VRTSSGTPKRRNATAKARHTARPVARKVAEAITQNREWSSTPVTIFTSVPSARNTPPTMSSCHNAIGASRSQRRYSSRRRRRARGATKPRRTRIRYTAIRDGTGDHPDRPSSCTRRRGPHRGCSRRSLHTAASTSASHWWGHDRGRRDRSINPARPSIR
jgi:hypothetical protein